MLVSRLKNYIWLRKMKMFGNREIIWRNVIHSHSICILFTSHPSLSVVQVVLVTPCLDSSSSSFTALWLVMFLVFSNSSTAWMLSKKLSWQMVTLTGNWFIILVFLMMNCQRMWEDVGFLAFVNIRYCSTTRSTQCSLFYILPLQCHELTQNYRKRGLVFMFGDLLL